MAAKDKEKGSELPATTSTALPAYLQKFQAQTQADTQSMAAASISVPRLSFRGKRFRFIVDGNEELVKDLTVDVVILGVEPEAGRMIKTYYEKAYQSGDSEPPTCSSSNGVRPDDWVQNPQNATCQGCRHNVFGSATGVNGGKSKSCKDSKRLWVAKPSDPTVYYGLNAPVTSLKNLSEYGKFIARHEIPLSLAITRLSLDDDSEYPKLIFEHVGFVSEEHADAVVELNTERPWRTEFASTPMLPEHSSAPSGAPQPQAAPPQAPVDTKKIDDVVGNW
jgi:hypothetical protein